MTPPSLLAVSAGVPAAPRPSAAPADPSDGDWWHDLLGRCRFPAPDAGPVTLAVSGGADSLALVELARRAGLHGVVVHVDHGLRAGSGGEAAAVADAAARAAFRFRSESVAVADGPDLEARARRARYGVLPDGVLTGHTMDDQAETVLLNVLRGASLAGMAGMSADAPGAGGIRLRRPLLGLRRADTSEVCRRAGLSPLVDPTNSDPRFRRNRVRAELLPLMGAIAERDLVPVLARQADLFGADDDLLERLSADLDPTDVAALRSSPPPLAHRALRRWLRSGAGHHPPSSAELARVMEVVGGARRACQISGGRRVWRRAGRLAVTDPCPSGPTGTAR